MDVLESFSLRGKTALLTGGAGLYGRQIAAALAEAGADTFIASLDTAALEKVAAGHERMSALHLDLASEDSIRAVVAEIVRRNGRLDILVNNAVTRIACGNWDRPQADYDASFHVNATGMFLLTRLAARDMQKRGAGSIINIGSYMGLLGPDPGNYLGTDMQPEMPSPIYFYEKGGMANFTRFAASVFGKFGIRVNCLHPGGFQTAGHPEAFVRQYSANTMLGRLANDSDLKGAVVFLASDASAYLTGTNIPVDGGYTAK